MTRDIFALEQNDLAIWQENRCSSLVNSLITYGVGYWRRIVMDFLNWKDEQAKK